MRRKRGMNGEQLTDRMLDTHRSHGTPLHSGGDQTSSTSPSLSLSSMTTSTHPHTPTGPSTSQMTNPPTGGDQTSSTSPSLSLSLFNDHIHTPTHSYWSLHLPNDQSSYWWRSDFLHWPITLSLSLSLQ